VRQNLFAGELGGPAARGRAGGTGRSGLPAAPADLRGAFAQVTSKFCRAGRSEAQQVASLDTSVQLDKADVALSKSDDRLVTDVEEAPRRNEKRRRRTSLREAHAGIHSGNCCAKSTGRRPSIGGIPFEPSSSAAPDPRSAKHALGLHGATAKSLRLVSADWRRT